MNRRIGIWAVIVMAAAVWTLVAAGGLEAQAMGKRPGLTQSEIKDKGHEAQQKAKTRWESLTPEEQAYVAEKGKQRAAQANMTAQEYWNSLSAEEQQRLMEGKEWVTERARDRWRKKPQ